MGSSLENTACPVCATVAGTLSIESSLQARPLGSFSLSGQMMKVSAIARPVLACSACDFRWPGVYNGRHAEFPPMPRYRDRQGQFIDVATWAEHYGNLGYRTVGNDIIGTTTVRTLWEGVLGLPLYTVLVQRGDADWSAVGYANTDADARKRHQRVVDDWTFLPD